MKKIKNIIGKIYSPSGKFAELAKLVCVITRFDICIMLAALHVFVYIDQLFLILYKELYYRHVYARVQVICIALVFKIIIR